MWKIFIFTVIQLQMDVVFFTGEGGVMSANTSNAEPAVCVLAIL